MGPGGGGRAGNTGRRCLPGTEFGARGAIITALVAMGAYPNHRTALGAVGSHGRTYNPDSARHALYQEYFGLYRQITRHLWDDWDLRADILERARGDAAHARESKI